MCKRINRRTHAKHVILLHLGEKYDACADTSQTITLQFDFRFRSAQTTEPTFGPEYTSSNLGQLN